MIEGQPSQTALHVAAARAAHLRYDPAPHLLQDHLAEVLLGDIGPDLIASYGNEASRWIMLENRLFIPLRARYAEDRLADAYRTGVRQLVVLGAGLDSYAFRRPADQSELRIFEVDHPSTQKWKTERVAALGWPIPGGHEFVACDFEKTSAASALAASGFASTEPAIVSWLGVTYYLEPETVRAALADLAQLLAPGSEVILDYMLPIEDLPERYQELQAAMREFLTAQGEPQSNRYRSQEILDRILEAGFSRAQIEEHPALFDRYIAPLASTIPISERFGLAVASNAKVTDGAAGGT